MEQGLEHTETAARSWTSEELEALGVIVWEADARSLAITFLSGNAERALGHPAADWKSPNFWTRRVHPEDLPRTMRVLADVAADGRKRTLRFRLMRDDGGIAWLWSLILRASHDGTSTLVGISGELGAGTMTDGDASLLSAVLGTAPVVLCVLSADGKLAFVEGEPLRRLKLDKVDLIGHNVRELFESVPWMVADYERAMRGESFVSGGSFGGRHFETHVRALHNGSGRFNGAIVVALDVSERKRAEADVVQSTERLSAILESVAEGITAQSRDGRILFANDAAARSIGVKDVDAVLTSPALSLLDNWEMFDEAGHELSLEELPGRAALRGEAAPQKLIRARRTDSGEESWRLLKATPVGGPGANVTMAVNVWTDVTAEKRLELRLAAENEVERIIAEGGTVDGSMPRILAAICRTFSWSCAAFWPKHDEDGWPKDAAWTSAEVSDAEVVRLLSDGASAEAEAIAAHVKEHGASWIVDPPGFPSLRTLCAAPVNESGFAGTIAIFARRNVAEQPELRGAMNELGTVIGQFMKRRRAERSLEFQQRLLECEMEAALDGILVVGPDRRVLGMNKRFVELWGIPPEVTELKSDSAAIQAVLNKVVEPGAFLARVDALYGNPFERSRDEILLRDGRVFDRYSAPVVMTDGTHRGRVWFFRDVTDQKRAQERDQRLASERSARAAAEAASVRTSFLADLSRLLSGSFHDRSLLLESARLAAGRICDWCVVDLFNTAGVLERVGIVHADPRKSTLASDLQDRPVTLMPQTPLAEAIRMRTAAVVGNVTPEELEQDPIHLCPLGTGSNECSRVLELGLHSFMTVPIVATQAVLGAFTFVTANEKGYDEDDLQMATDLGHRVALAIENGRLFQLTQQAVAARDEFLSIASHELRTPITSIQLALQAMDRAAHQSKDQESPVVRSLMDAALRQTLRLGKLVGDLLDVSRIRAGRLLLELKSSDLGELVKGVISEFVPDAQSAGSELRVNVEPGITGVVDRGRLEQVVANLVSNAIKYGGGKPITITFARVMPTLARLSVKDEGIGIPYERQGQIFDPFERAVSSRNYGGLGLGLFIVRKIVNALGGTVSVSSQPGLGSTFTVELPCSPTPPATDMNTGGKT